MGIAERKGRERAAREHRITMAARRIAESQGWSAVTIRRLADEIEYSQPVLYSHFANKDAIVTAVAIVGFEELATALKEAARGSPDRRLAIETVATAYLDFAKNNPALYEAMFTLPTRLRFADSETRSELRAAFAALAAVVRPSSADVGVATETLWATLHGLAALERSGRIRSSACRERVALVVDGVLKS